MAKREATLRAEAQSEAATATATAPPKAGRRIVLTAARAVTIDGVLMKAGIEVATFESVFPLGCIMSALKGNHLAADEQPLFPVTDPHVKP